MTALLTAPLVFALEISSADAGSPRRARRWLAWVLEVAGVPQQVIEACVLAVSEMVTNAVVHGDSPRILVSVEVLDAGVRLAVHDDAPFVTAIRTTHGLPEHGRGLLIVDALATDLDITTDEHGTTVTALIPHQI